jgi:hypothetical protein
VHKPPAGTEAFAALKNSKINVSESADMMIKMEKDYILARRSTTLAEGFSYLHL